MATDDCLSASLTVAARASAAEQTTGVAGRAGRLAPCARGWDQTEQNIQKVTKSTLKHPRNWSQFAAAIALEIRIHLNLFNPVR